jgi:hypothetical protein
VRLISGVGGVLGVDRAEYRAFIAAEQAKWSKVVQAIGFKV